MGRGPGSCLTCSDAQGTPKQRPSQPKMSVMPRVRTRSREDTGVRARGLNSSSGGLLGLDTAPGFLALWFIVTKQRGRPISEILKPLHWIQPLFLNVFQNGSSPNLGTLHLILTSLTRGISHQSSLTLSHFHCKGEQC